YHLSILAASFVLGPVAGLFPYLAPIALLPVTSKALLSVGLRVKKASPIRLIGYTEVIHTLVFMALAGAAFLIN
ncbi:MAG: hypothetical protein ACE5IJ_07660, partial [Thermoplasmata archaeon]